MVIPFYLPWWEVTYWEQFWWWWYLGILLFDIAEKSIHRGAELATLQGKCCPNQEAKAFDWPFLQEAQLSCMQSLGADGEEQSM